MRDPTAEVDVDLVEHSVPDDRTTRGPSGRFAGVAATQGTSSVSWSLSAWALSPSTRLA